MIPPYGFGFDSHGYPPAELEIDFKALGRNCKALAKKLGRRIHRKLRK